jgi:hypothetical protein
MAELVLIGRDEHGEEVFEEMLTDEEVGIRWAQSEEGRLFIAKYDLNDNQNAALFGAVLARLGEDYTLEQIQNLTTTILRAGGLVTFPEDVRVEGTDTNYTVTAGRYEFVERELPVAQKPDPQPEVPRDKNGRPLSEAQLKWSEYTTFAKEHSSRECDERARTDVGFASFRKTNLRREMAETPVGGGATNLNQRPETRKDDDPLLRKFADAWKMTPSAKLKPIDGSVSLIDGSKYSKAEYDTLVERMAQAGL